MPAQKKLAFALDYANLIAAEQGARQVCASAGVLKVGLELYLRAGAAAVDMARDCGSEVFLDLKLHDIPKTVERAVAVVADLGVRYLTVHTQGGPRMMECAAQMAEKKGGITVLGVTVLTSLESADLRDTGYEMAPSSLAQRLARLAKESGLGGLVCSAQEVAEVRTAVGKEMVLVTPGIRAFGDDRGDQKRVVDPVAALRSGSDLLVVGRPIRDAQDPAAAAAAFAQLIESA